MGDNMFTNFDELKARLYEAMDNHKHLNNEEALKISRQIDLFIIQYYKDVQGNREPDSARNWVQHII